MAALELGCPEAFHNELIGFLKTTVG